MSPEDALYSYLKSASIPKIVQVTHLPELGPSVMLLALCDDGSLWLGHFVSGEAWSLIWTSLPTPQNEPASEE